MSTTAGPSSQSSSEVRPATLGERFLALLIDWILCLLLAVAVAPQPYGNLWASAVLVLEYAVFIGLFTQTPGMRVAKIRCVRLDGERLGLYRAFIRGVLLALVVPALIMDSDRRGLHDRAAESVVIR
ncbi:RDD family protein [Phytomonospora sp. NPDC050363]|uniref:RDD family protein n=1 Tax=Phytomonospora sp. NPDC050363 TaxID=3155642 RepID=UPI0033C13C54